MRKLAGKLFHLAFRFFSGHGLHLWYSCPRRVTPTVLFLVFPPAPTYSDLGFYLSLPFCWLTGMDLRRLLLLIPTVTLDAEAWTWRKEERFGELVLFFKGDGTPTEHPSVLS